MKKNKTKILLFLISILAIGIVYKMSLPKYDLVITAGKETFQMKTYEEIKKRTEDENQDTLLSPIKIYRKGQKIDSFEDFLFEQQQTDPFSRYSLNVKENIKTRKGIIQASFIEYTVFSENDWHMKSYTKVKKYVFETNENYGVIETYSKNNPLRSCNDHFQAWRMYRSLQIS